MALRQSWAPSSLRGGDNLPTILSGPSARSTQPVLDLGALQGASRVLQDQLLKDAQIIPDLGEMLTIPGGQSSGSYTVFPDDFRVPFQKRRLIGIPEGLFQFYNSTNVTSHMGLMAEIERVWITIDHKLFLWDYIEGQEISSFVDQPNVISHVVVVKPKPGVFIDEITSLLVICTPISVLLIGLSAAPVSGSSGGPRKEIKLYATDMSVATEVEMTSVIGMPDGRIFMCGTQDGQLYELHYQDKESWFGKRVQMVNHTSSGMQSFLPKFSLPKSEERIIVVVSDAARNCFYTLSSKNSISVYSPNGEKVVQHVQTLSNLYKLAQDKAPGSPALNPQTFQLISIHVIELTESRSGVQLLAITTNGVRLYFSPMAVGYTYYSGSSSSSLRPLQLVHVRLPPVNLLHPDEQSNPHRPSVTSYGGAVAQVPVQQPSRPYVLTALENSCYSSGLTIAAQQGDTDGADYIVCMAPDLSRIGSLGQSHAPNLPHQQASELVYMNPSYSSNAAPPYGGGSINQRPPLTEQAVLVAIPGRTWAMAAVPRQSQSSASATPSNAPNPVVTNELAYQFSEPPRQFMILTNVGLTFLAKRRALDYLRDVIEEFQVEGNVKPLVEFRDSFGRDQTCAMLLALASGNTFLDLGEQSNVGVISTISPEIAGVARQAFYDLGERPTWTERVNYGSSDTSGTTIFSGRREGFALYFARLVRPIWRAKLTKLAPHGSQESNVSEHVLNVVQKNLYALKEFLDKNQHLFQAVTGDLNAAGRLPATGEQEAWKKEQTSVVHLQALLSRTVEAISFMLLLHDYKLAELAVQCESSVQKLIANLTYEELITTPNGVAVSRGLVNVVINQQIGQQISVDTISEVLQMRCGTFCSTDDVMLYKAQENIRKAAEMKNPMERQNLLAESLRLFIKGSRILEFEKLREVCGDYQHLSYAKGAIELPLHCAQTLDVDNVGRDYWHAGSPPNDPRSQVFDGRLHCYQLVLDSLVIFEEQSSNSGIPTGQHIDDADSVRSYAYELAFSSEDEMFHSTLYEWLISRRLADELLEMRPAFLEAHLKREPITAQNYQLLWQFYVKDGQPLRAAEVLATLAESEQFDLPLDARVEYVTLAVGNAKSHPVSEGAKYENAVAFLTELEEKLDVAQVQLELYSALLPHLNDPNEAGEKVKQLSRRLFTISELYQGYAEPFDLPLMKLLILHVSEHLDEGLVRPIWNRIFDSAMEGDDPEADADRIRAKVIPLGQRFYPSESAFPLRHISALLVRFTLANKAVPAGWAPRILAQCRVPYTEIWDIFHEMYESQIPPFNEQRNVQAVSSDIAVLLTDWLEDAKRPQSTASRGEFLVDRIHQYLDQYLAELDPSRTETRELLQNLKRQLVRNF